MKSSWSPIGPVALRVGVLLCLASTSVVVGCTGPGYTTRGGDAAGRDAGVEDAELAGDAFNDYDGDFVFTEVDGGDGDGETIDAGESADAAVEPIDAWMEEIVVPPEPPEEPDPEPAPMDDPADPPVGLVQRTLRVVHWNVAGSKIHRGDTDTGLIETIARTVIERDAHFVSLNELCHTQYDALRRELRMRGWPEDPDHFSHFVAAIPGGRGRCHGESYGNAIFSRRALGSARRFTFPSDGSHEDRVMVCAGLRALPHLRFCSTHLTHLGRVGPQIGAMRHELERFDDAGDTVIVAGDLNTTPGDPLLDQMYSASLATRVNMGNHGRFRELDDTDPVCAGHGERTTPNMDGGACGRGPKIDYIFARQSRLVGEYSADVLNIPTTCRGRACSDHRIVTGRVTVRVRL